MTNTMRTALISSVTLLALAVQPVLADQSLDAAIAAWTETWSPGALAAEFSADRLDPTYAKDGLLAFDTNAPIISIIDGREVYESTWLPYMQETAFWDTLSVDVMQSGVSGETAWAALTFQAVAQPETVENRDIYESHATLVFQMTPDGWRVVHEHISSPVRR
jgi:ketosteroid isomerase-like protein